jgi:hypothetical protein
LLVAAALCKCRWYSGEPCNSARASPATLRVCLHIAALAACHIPHYARSWSALGLCWPCARWRGLAQHVVRAEVAAALCGFTHMLSFIVWLAPSGSCDCACMVLPSELWSLACLLPWTTVFWLLPALLEAGVHCHSLALGVYISRCSLLVLSRGWVGSSALHFC